MKDKLERLLELAYGIEVWQDPKLLIDSNKEFQELKQQFRQHYEDAKKYNKFFDELCRNVDMDDIVWDGGEINNKEFTKRISKDRQTVKRIVEEYNKFKLQYENLGGDKWKGTKPRVFEIFEKILEETNQLPTIGTKGNP